MAETVESNEVWTQQNIDDLLSSLQKVSENQTTMLEKMENQFKAYDRQQKEFEELQAYKQTDEYKLDQQKETDAMKKAAAELEQNYKNTEDIMKALQSIDERAEKSSESDELGNTNLTSTLVEIKKDLAKYQEQRSESDMSIMIVTVFTILLIIGFSGFLKTLFSR